MCIARTARLGLLALVAATAARAGEPLAAFTLTLVGGKAVTVKQASATKWTCAEGKATHALAAEGQDFTFHQDDAPLATGKLEDGKLKMKLPDGTLYLVVKLKIDKAKFSLTDDDEGWEIKTKGEKAKLRKGETEFAKCKFYPDTGKLKVKDAKENTVIESRDLRKLSAAPLALVAPKLDADRRKLLMLFLFAKKR